jgi:aryl-alcohol dehydrogenase-like predicted oxidoreductase
MLSFFSLPCLPVGAADVANLTLLHQIAKALGMSELRNLARFDTLQAYYSLAGRDIEREISSHAGI